MSEQRDRVVRTMRDLLHFTDMAARLVSRGRAAYDQDEALRLASEAILHKIGEAAGRIPESVWAEYPQIEWRSMRATRNIVAHQYNQVDYDIIWNAFTHRLPGQADLIRTALRELESDAGGV